MQIVKRHPALALFAALLCWAGCSRGPENGPDPFKDPLVAAESVARGVVDSVRKQTALVSIAVSNAESGRFSDAERVAGMIHGADDRVWVWTQIAMRYIDSGRTLDAVRALDAAHAVVPSVAGGDARMVALTDLARGYGKSGNRARAEDLLDQAQAVADTTADPFFHVRRLTQIAEAAAGVGDTLRADSILTSAVSLMDTARGPVRIAVGYIARAYGTLNRPEEAIRLAREDAGERVRFDGLLAAATAYYRRGERAVADSTLARAAELARGRDEFYVKAPGLGQVARAYAHGGSRQRALDLLGELQTIANALDLPPVRFDAATVIAECFVALGEFDAAGDAVTRTLEYSSALRTPNMALEGTRSILSLAEQFIDSGSTSNAVRLLDRALVLSELIEATDRVETISQIIFDYARAGAYDRAMELIRSSPIDPAERAGLLAALGAEHVKTGRAPGERELELLESLVRELEQK